MSDLIKELRSNKLIPNTTPKIIPSHYQNDIYDCIVNTNLSIIVQANPGSGKTTTAIEAAKLIPRDKEILFTSFGNAIVKELQSRLPVHVHCATLHSIGMRAIMSHFRTNLTINEYKSFKFIEEIIKTKPEGFKRKENDKSESKSSKAIIAYKYNMRHACELIRMTMTPLNEDAIFKMCCMYNIDLLQEEMLDVIHIVGRMEMYNRSLTKGHNYIDYVDMITMPISNYKIKLPQYDVIFIDEAQDLNVSQQQLVERLLIPKGRIIAIGDKNQAIFSFMGSDMYSFEKLQNRANSKLLPLSISYRCPTSIVALAKTIYSEIEPNPTNIEGEIRYGDISEIKSGDACLCRNNRPLIYVYFELLERGLNPIIIGKDIQVGLEALISKYLKKEVDEGVELIYERLEKVKEELIARGVKKYKEHTKYQSLLDKIMTIEIIARRFTYMHEVYKEIGEMFKEKENCITLATIHKAKGKEWENVFYIERFDGKKLLPSPYAVQEWEKVAERNLQFVCYTRTKNRFIIISNIELK